MLLRARMLLPMNAPLIEDGAVRVEGGRIVGVGPWRELRGEATDLGEVILIPGLVNAHCHLDYTCLAGRIPAPESFNEWIADITRFKSGMDDIAWRQSWINGAKQCLRYGTTTIGNIETRPELLPGLWAKTNLRLLSFLELIAVQPVSDADDLVKEAVGILNNHEPRNGAIGLSPHAPYTVRPDALRQCTAAATQNGWRMAMHLAESTDEDAMFRKGTGPLFQRLSAVGRDMSDCGHQSSVASVASHGVLSERLLAIHTNYLDDDDIQRISKSGASIAHCPRSHEYFRHAPFRFESLQDAGINVCLGTDSLATNANASAELNMFAEMQAFRRANPHVNGETVVRMATVNGARGLGWEGSVGEITIGAYADMITLPLGGSGDGLYENIVNCTAPPQEVMIQGNWAVLPEKVDNTGTL